MIIIFVFLYIFSIYGDDLSQKSRNHLLAFIVASFAIFVGLSTPFSDAARYIVSFEQYTENLSKIKWGHMPPVGYAEYGFYFLGVLLKVFTNNGTFYFLFISALTCFFLYKIHRKYCLYPMLGFCVYVARFAMGRNFIQLRAGLAYAILILAVQYIDKKDWKRYFFIVFLAYQLHHSALLAIPIYFLCQLKLKRIHIYIGLTVAFILGTFFQGPIHSIVEDQAEDLSITSYVVGIEVEKALGMSNPMIYFQTLFLLLFTLGESKLRKMISYYYSIRTAYLYSTFILITFCSFLGLSGRTSTLYATFEIVIIPAVVQLVPRSMQSIVLLGVGVVLSVILYMKLLPTMSPWGFSF